MSLSSHIQCNSACRPCQCRKPPLLATSPSPQLHQQSQLQSQALQTEAAVDRHKRVPRSPWTSSCPAEASVLPALPCRGKVHSPPSPVFTLTISSFRFIRCSSLPSSCANLTSQWRHSRARENRLPVFNSPICMPSDS